ncbi:hypothetical protein [Arcobacter arenosus]|jgi:uncharacterized membrane protein|uniref:Uncharacterized protein n=1 Tax=Arcobacter arenosus TaxID=2576037 RepID=A0A5R8Y3P0_9BACT|nr:hypothetical protein [Arcobacter arenosus]TLP40729.1 hypothetical protein FDK22_01565 [Arcobacter arenosus]
MQFVLVILIAIVLVAFLIYKMNNKFETKEIAILVLVIIVTIAVANFTIKNQEEKVPNLFVTKYETEKNSQIEKFTFERLNNKTVSSNTEFIYNFDYIVKKDGKEFVCSAKGVKIKKIQDEYVFENFDTLNEKCDKK